MGKKFECGSCSHQGKGGSATLCDGPLLMIKTLDGTSCFYPNVQLMANCQPIHILIKDSISAAYDMIVLFLLGILYFAWCRVDTVFFTPWIDIQLSDKADCWGNPCTWMVMIVLVLIKTNLSTPKLWQREYIQIAEPCPPKPPKEPTFSCPICMGPLVEEMTTKCGHIFCKSCIKAAITVQGKCPTCRRKVTARDIHRVYLPTTN